MKRILNTCEGRLILGFGETGDHTPGELLALLGEHAGPPPLGPGRAVPGHGGRVADLSQTNSRLRR